MEDILGNINTINKQTLEEIRLLYKYKVPHDQLISVELINQLIELTGKIKKEIALYIDRKGCVKLVAIGTSNLVQIPEFWVKRNLAGFSGVRCIHTHPNGNSTLSREDISALINFKLDAMIALGVGENITGCIGLLQPYQGELTNKHYLSKSLNINQLLKINFLTMIIDLEKQIEFKGHLIESRRERAILAIVESQNLDEEIAEVINELRNLSETAGLEIVDTIVQKRQRPDPAFLIGKGKLAEITSTIQNLQANCIVFENALTPSQQNNLIEYLGIKVIDRTNLILDIFAQRAKSKEGKLQVELAQLNYLLPRLSGKGVNLSRLGGGVGTRGPGETKLETDRRHIRTRIESLKKELCEVEKHRSITQNNRIKQRFPLIALVGYTNAGKSSLLNTLAIDTVFEEDKLFATLDTTTRSIYLDNEHYKVLLTDTVGFIRNLPHQLISAFKSTLEEVQSADLLLHVIDISNKNFENHIKTVDNVLLDLNVFDKPVIYVFNKSDLLTEEPVISINNNEWCFISAKTGEGLKQLRHLIKNELFVDEVKCKFFIPYEKGHLLDQVYKNGQVQIITHNEVGTEIVLITRKKFIPKELIKYQVME